MIEQFSFRSVTVITMVVAVFLPRPNIGAEATGGGPPAGKINGHPNATIAVRPNIVLLMADDLGYQDLSAFGNDRITTPAIDRIANEGLKMSRYYTASAVCTPTRASMLTGRYPIRYGIEGHFRDTGEYLPETTTLAGLLRDAGYRTAHVGKWHLGGLRVKDTNRRDEIPGPHQHGFDRFLTQIEEQPLRGRMGAERLLFRRGGTVLLRDDRRINERDPRYRQYLTDAFADEAIDYIENFVAEGETFFLNLWWLTPHTPYEPAPEPHWTATAADGITDDQHRFRSMVARMDYQVGRILDVLDREGIADDTIVVFCSDNGGAWEANNGSLKAGKTDLHDGGVRTPAAVRYPRCISPGRFDDLVHSTDWLPTLVAATDTPRSDVETDGLNLWPSWTDGAPVPERGDLYWQIEFYRNLQRHEPKPVPYATEAVRRGRWKMLSRGGEPVELFDVEADPGEHTNLLSEQPTLVESMRRGLQRWLEEPRRPFGRED